jgi:hypothetical protein
MFTFFYEKPTDKISRSKMPLNRSRRIDGHFYPYGAGKRLGFVNPKRAFGSIFNLLKIKERIRDFKLFF